MKFGSAFNISIGMVLARKKAKEYDGSECSYKVLTLKCVNDIGEIDKENVEDFISKQQVEDSYLTQKGDIIIRLTEPYSTIYIDEINQGLLIPSNFGIIRAKDNAYHMEFIKYYLNSAKGKREIKKSAAGSTLASISIANLKELEIKNYDLQTQEKFIATNKLFEKEKKLINELLEQRNQQLDGIINELLK